MNASQDFDDSGQPEWVRVRCNLDLLRVAGSSLDAQEFQSASMIHSHGLQAHQGLIGSGCGSAMGCVGQQCGDLLLRSPHFLRFPVQPLQLPTKSVPFFVGVRNHFGNGLILLF
jgi:hypothetical protein